MMRKPERKYQLRPVGRGEGYAPIHLTEEERKDFRKFLQRVAVDLLASMGLQEEDAILVTLVPASDWTLEDRMEVYGEIWEHLGEEQARLVVEEMPKALPPSPEGMWVAVYVRSGKWYVTEVRSRSPIKA